MKKWIVPIVIVALFLIYAVSARNGLVNKDELVNESWSNVETNYQRRMDLIGNLVNTVKGYANFEQETLIKVIDARSKATSVNIDATNLTPETFERFQQAQVELSNSLSRLLVTIEKYPDLKANTNFIELQNELTRTENKIVIARRDYNATVKDYNISVRTFPKNLVASAFGFQKKEMFKSDAGSEKAPKVDFSK